MKKSVTVAVIAGLVLAACSTTKEESASDTTGGATESTAAATTTAAAADTTTAPADTAADTTAADTTVAAATPSFPPVVDDRAPGVTDTSIQVGVMYLDLSSVAATLGINQGDYQAAYQAAIDEFNAKGGVNGRTIDPVFVPIVPATTDTGAIACTKLTQDTQVFVAIGSYLADAAECIVATNDTQLLGGDLNADVRAKATALWMSADAGESLAAGAVDKMIADGLLKGKVGIVGATGFEAAYASIYEPSLQEAGIDVAEVAYLDVSNNSSDPNALFAAAETIALKFQSEDIETIFMIAGTGPVFPVGLARTDYRPTLAFDALQAATTYVSGDGNDLSVLEGASTVGPYDSSYFFNDLGSPTSDCIESQEAALGVEILEKGDVAEGEANYHVSSFIACRYVALLSAILEKAGPTLNRGTFQTAAENLGPVMLAGYAEPFNFDKDHPDGAPTLYTYQWDSAQGAMLPKDA